MQVLRYLTATLLIAVASPCWAGLYSDDLARCLVASTTPQDKATLAKWMFTVMAQHPAVAKLTTITAADVDKANGDTGALFMTLLTQSCVDKAKAAIRYEGPAAMQASFSVLGQAAIVELMADPAVAAAVAGLGKYVDPKKLEALKQK